MSYNKAPTLRQLPLEQQLRVIALLQTHTRKETRDLLAAEFGVQVSERTLGRFRAWWHMTRSLELAAEFADAFRDRLHTPQQDAAQRERIHEAAQLAFELAAIERQDLAAFVNLRKLRQRDQIIEIARQRLETTTAGRTNTKSFPSNSVWTEEDRQAVMRKVDEVFGIADESPNTAQPNPPPCPP